MEIKETMRLLNRAKSLLRHDQDHIADASKMVGLRDYFAAKAMQGLMSIYWEVEDEFSTADELVKSHAETAYEYADAMLKEREKC